jgi:hypothetical protein
MCKLKNNAMWSLNLLVGLGWLLSFVGLGIPCGIKGQMQLWMLSQWILQIWVFRDDA